MKTKAGLLAILAGVVWCGTAYAQSAALSPSSGPPPKPIEPIDAAFVPQIDSKVGSLQLVSAVRENVSIQIKLKNVSEKKIYSFRYSYHESGQSAMLGFVESDDRTFLAPGEVFTYDYPFIPTSIFARQPVSFQAVLFEDGTGDGEPAKVKSLQDVFLRNRKELEHVIAILTEAIESPQIEVVTNNLVLDKLSETPDYMYGVDLHGIAGMTLTSWKATAMHLVQDIQEARSKGATESIRESLEKIITRFKKTLAKYPAVA